MENKGNATIGATIKQAITDSGFESIAGFARYASIAESTIYLNISGNKSPTVDMLNRYADGMGRRLVIRFDRVQ